MKPKTISEWEAARLVRGENLEAHVKRVAAGAAVMNRSCASS
jgi:hypothetical protein